MITLQWIASIWCQNNQKTQNYKSNQITINLHRFDAKTIKNVELRRKTFKTTQIYKTDQITMNCIDLMSKQSKNAKLQKQSNNDQSVSIWRENVELRRKTFKTTQNYENDQIIMNCIDLTSKRSQQRKTTKVIKL